MRANRGDLRNASVAPNGSFLYTTARCSAPGCASPFQVVDVTVPAIVASHLLVGGAYWAAIAP